MTLPRCGRGYRYEKIAEVQSVNMTSYTVRKLADRKTALKKGTFYKFMVLAFANTSPGTRKILSTSKSVHVITKGKANRGNCSRVIVNKKKVILKKGKAFQIKAEMVPESGRKVTLHRKPVLLYESDHPDVVKVSRNGKVKAKKKGTAVIYVYAQNGVFAKVTVKVKP